MIHPEIVIRGAGPVGCVAALALDHSGRSVVLSDGRSAPASFRPIALSHASRLILERVGAWPSLRPTQIETIEVSQQGGFGRTRLSAAEAGVPALGYVVEYAVLLGALQSRVKDRGIRIDADAGESLLVVHAEGSAGDAREKSYPHEAVVAPVTTEPAAAGAAWERFTPEGPLALLPLGERYGAIWVMRPERARELCAAPASSYLGALGEAFGRRAGAFVAAGERSRVPLALRVRPSRIGERSAYIGNAAQTLHPVAGQGLNLGLRDAWDLAQVLRDAGDPGDARVLRKFARLRRLDAAATVKVTDFLAGAFVGADPLTGLIRGFALTALDICLPARRFFARRMIYGTSALP